MTLVEISPFLFFFTRTRCCTLKGGPTGIHIIPPKFNCSINGGGIKSEAQVTMIASKGAYAFHPK